MIGRKHEEETIESKFNRGSLEKTIIDLWFLCPGREKIKLIGKVEGIRQENKRKVTVLGEAEGRKINKDIKV